MNKLGTKILKVIGSISVISMAILIILNMLTFKIEFSKLQDDAKDSAVEAVKVIDGDKVEKVINSRTMDIPEYKQVQDEMIRFKNDKDIKYIYTLAKASDSDSYFVVDGSLVDTSELGEKLTLEDEMKGAFEGQAIHTRKPVADSYGTFISAYAPIKNSSGKIIAIVGVDKEVGTFINIRNKLITSIVVAAAFIIILSILVSVIFSKRISLNVEKIRYTLKKNGRWRFDN